MKKSHHDLLANLSVFFACVLLVGMVFSPFLLSVGMWFFVFTALGHAALEHPKPADFWANRSVWLARTAWVLAAAFRQFFCKKALLALSLLFWLPVVSGLWSDDLHFWLERVRVRLPFFVVPFAFANLPVLGARRLNGALAFLVWMLVLTCIGIGINYLVHFQEIMQAIEQGRHIPVPRDHIRFSLTLAVGILAAGWLSVQKFQLRWAWERGVMWAATVFLFVFIHILSVRSGLVALYAALFFTLGWFVVSTKKWLIGLALLAGLLALPLLAVKTLPSVAQKVAYMRWDWSQYSGATGGLYSDSGRMVSLRGGWDLAKKHPLLGVGTGDLPMEIQRFVDANFPQYSRDPKLPHNQFMYILAATGVLGLAVSLWAFYGLFFRKTYRRAYLLMAFQAVVFVSFLVEYTIETAIGVAFYLFFQLWFMKAAEEG
ncbi:MAG: O-antigen ligase family protein [Saprospiraceae bacterium]